MENKVKEYLEKELRSTEEQLIKLIKEHRSFENYYEKQIIKLRELLEGINKL